MRTTLILDDALFRRAKQRAAELGTTLSDVVNRALQDALRPRPERAAGPRFTMTVFGDPGRPVRHEPAELAATADRDDIQALGR